MTPREKFAGANGGTNVYKFVALCTTKDAQPTMSPAERSGVNLVRKMIQLAPEARQKVARGKRSARSPWGTINNTTRPAGA